MSYIWDNGNVTQILGPTLPYGSEYGICITSINNEGQVLCRDNDSDAAYIYQNGNYTSLTPPFSGMIAVPLGNEAINNLGQAIVSYVDINPALDGTYIVDDHSAIRIGDIGSAFDINDLSQVVVNKSGEAFLVDENGTTFLGTLGGESTNAYAINNNSQVVGSSDIATGSEHAFIWSEKNGMIDLNDVLNSEYSWLLTSARDINDKGQIVGSGLIDLNGDGIFDATHPYLLTPEWDAIVTTGTNYLMNMTLGNTFSFDYWWEMGQEPAGFNMDIFYFRDNSWHLLGGDVNIDGSSTGWESISMVVPEELRGVATQIRFGVLDLFSDTDPTVYLRNIASNGAAPVPEPTTLILLGAGLVGLAGFRKKYNEMKSNTEDL